MGGAVQTRQASLGDSRGVEAHPTQCPSHPRPDFSCDKLSYGARRQGPGEARCRRLTLGVTFTAPGGCWTLLSRPPWPGRALSRHALLPGAAGRPQPPSPGLDHRAAFLSRRRLQRRFLRGRTVPMFSSATHCLRSPPHSTSHFSYFVTGEVKNHGPTNRTPRQRPPPFCLVVRAQETAADWLRPDGGGALRARAGRTSAVQAGACSGGGVEALILADLGRCSNGPAPEAERWAGD